MSPQRLLPALVLIPLLLYASFLDAWAYAVALFAFAAVGAWEFLRMLQRAGHHPAWAITLPLTVLLALGPVLPAGLAAHALMVGTIVALAWAAFRHGRDNGLLDWAVGIAPAIYVGGLLAYFLLLRGLPHGDHWVRVVLLCTWAADTAAYLVGRRWGHAKLAPTLSPNKSVEGAVAGVVAAGLAGGAIGILWPVGNLAAAVGLGLGLLIGVAGMVGDLVESFIKRQLGAKDASRLLGGHGGVLDRLDSLLVAGMVAYYYLWAVSG